MQGGFTTVMDRVDKRLPDDLRSMISNPSFKLVDLWRINDEDLSSDPVFYAGLLVLKHTSRPKTLPAHLDKIAQALVAAPTMLERCGMLLAKALGREKLPLLLETIRKHSPKLEEEFKMNILDSSWKDGITEGEARGRAEGEARGETRGVATMLADILEHRFGKKRAKPYKQRFLQSEARQIETYRTRIWTVTSPEEVFA
jgi:hypothetical protein